jgi:copper chaperone
MAIEEKVLNVPDISCEHCVKTINAALSTLEGMQSVQVDIPTRTVQVRYDPQRVTMDQIAATLDEAGYTIAE